MNLRKDHCRCEAKLLFQRDTNLSGLPAHLCLGRSRTPGLACPRGSHGSSVPARPSRPCPDGSRLASGRGEPLKESPPCSRRELKLEPFPALGCEKLNGVLPFLFSQLRRFGSDNQRKERKQHCTVDHLARGSMKNAANCASECELQDT